MRIVVDASIAVEYLLRTAVGREAAGILADSILVSPELLDVEVMSAVRRAVMRRELDEERALMALEDLIAWPLERILHTSLIGKHGSYAET